MLDPVFILWVSSTGYIVCRWWFGTSPLVAQTDSVHGLYSMDGKSLGFFAQISKFALPGEMSSFEK